MTVVRIFLFIKLKSFECSVSLVFFSSVSVCFRFDEVIHCGFGWIHLRSKYPDTALILFDFTLLRFVLFYFGFLGRFSRCAYGFYSPK